jgi:general secretion pathway protein A
MADFGIPCESRQKSQVLLELKQWLLEGYQAGERAVLIVDEAQSLSPEMREEIPPRNCSRSFSRGSLS